LLGDLHLEECVQHFAEKLRELNTLDAVSQFASAVLDLSRAIDANPRFEKPKELFEAAEWKDLKEQAQKLIDLPSSASFRSHRY
jgi:hypothetical protein